jgi:hypothetical protein
MAIATAACSHELGDHGHTLTRTRTLSGSGVSLGVDGLNAGERESIQLGSSTKRRERTRARPGVRPSHLQVEQRRIDSARGHRSARGGGHLHAEWLPMRALLEKRHAGPVGRQLRLCLPRAGERGLPRRRRRHVRHALQRRSRSANATRARQARAGRAPGPAMVFVPGAIAASCQRRA